MDVQRNILRKMINKWAEVSTLNIREQTDPSVKDDDVDILIRFVRGFHNDPYPFDGPGGTLAHAYYPHNNKGKQWSVSNVTIHVSHMELTCSYQLSLFLSLTTGFRSYIMVFKQSQISSDRIEGDKSTSFCNYSVLPSLNKVYYYYYYYYYCYWMLC